MSRLTSTIRVTKHTIHIKGPAANTAFAAMMTTEQLLADKAEGPFKAAVDYVLSGRFIGNRHQSTLDAVRPGSKQTARDIYTIGEPKDCPAGTVAEMKERGYVGLYFKK